MLRLIWSIGVLWSINVYGRIHQSTLRKTGKETLEKTGTTGAYLSVSHKGKVLFSEAFGYNHATTKEKLTDTTPFPISSNTKAFNSILLSQLAEKERIEFSKPLKTYLPDLQLKNGFMTSELTTMDILTHRWGIPRYDFTYYLLEEGESNTNKKVVEKFKYLENSQPFRTGFQYGNNQYILAAYLTETVTGEKWEDRLRTKLLSPLGMLNTHCDLQRYLEDDKKSQGYQKKTPVSMDLVKPLYWVSGMGNMFSTISDLEKWTHFLLEGNDSVLSKEWIDYNLTGHTVVGYEEPYSGFSNIEYGLGWFIFDYYGHKVVMHHGDNLGHQSIIVLLPDDGYSWVIVANEGMRANSFPFRMTFTLLDMIAKQPKQDWNTRLHQEDMVYYRHSDSLKTKDLVVDDYVKYTGEYHHKGFGRITITEESGRLHLKAGGFKGILEPYKRDEFIIYEPEFKEDYLFRFLTKEKRVIGLKTDLIEPMLNMVEFKKQ